jgi:tetratricopeptide (TPR) repeat protein
VSTKTYAETNFELSCPAPLAHKDTILLGHGSGGKLSAELIRDIFLPAFRNPVLARLDDQATLNVNGQRLAMTTDSFVVKPLFFPGGDIGSLAVHGTVNDLAMGPLTLAPTMREAVLGLARVLLEQDKASRALSLLVGYLERTPDDDEARELLARAHSGIGQHRSAAQQLITVFNRLPEADDSLSDRKAYLAVAIGSFLGIDRRDKEAESWLLKAIKIAPQKYPLAYQNLGRLYYRSDRLAEAYRTISECKKLFPSDQTASDLLASIYSQEGFYEDAIRELQPIIGSGQAKAEIYNSLACTLEYNHDQLKAESVLREGHAKYPENRSIIHNLIYVLLVNHNIVEARQCLEKHKATLNAYARESPSYDAILTATWGLVYVLEGKTELGIQFYKQASKTASHAGNGELSGSILQKMHIEVAKHLIRQGDKPAAQREIAAGLGVKRGREIYKRELKYLGEVFEKA